MNKTTLRKKLIDISGYWLYKKSVLPVGADITVDIKNKIGIQPRIIFDVGANVGQTAKFLTRHFPTATIHSFEPVSSSFEILSAATSGNPNVRCHHIALSDVQQQLAIKLFEGSASVLNSINDHLQNSSEGAKVEMITTNTLDQFIAEHNITEIDLLKIDTEGYEIPVLKGSIKALESNKIKMIYLEVGFSRNNVRNTFLTDIVEFLVQNNFSLFGLYEIHHYDIQNGNHFGNALFVHQNHLKNNTDY